MLTYLLIKAKWCTLYSLPIFNHIPHEKFPKIATNKGPWLCYLIISLTLRGLLEINLSHIMEEKKILHDSLVKKVREKDRLQRRLKNMLLQHQLSQDALLHTQELYNKMKAQVSLHCYFYTHKCFECCDSIHDSLSNNYTNNKFYNGLFCIGKDSPTVRNSVTCI